MVTGHSLSRTGLVMAMVMSFAGCEDPRPGALSAHERIRQPVHVDSIIPIAEDVRRFRAALGKSVDRLDGGAPSPEALVAQFIVALEARDVTALQTMTLTPVEFIEIYYPHTHFTAPPYEMSPHLVWFQLENYGGKGLNRLLDRFGGRPLGYEGQACDDRRIEGPNTLLSDCTLTIREPGADPRTVSLFGQMIGHDGVWKFINYANGL